MRRPSRSLAAALAMALATSLTRAAPADLPPPDGTRYIEFAISVQSLAAFPDFVVVAYPRGNEHFVMTDGKPLSIGRRSKETKLWAIGKADYEAFTAGRVPPPIQTPDRELDAFFQSGKAMPCSAEIRRVHRVFEDDPRDTVLQTFRAEAVDATRCVLVDVAGEASAPAPSEEGTSSCSGCSGCTVSPPRGERRAVVHAMAVAAAAVVLARRRRRRR